MYRPLQRTLLGLAGVALLGQWVAAGQAVGAAATTVAQTTSYVVQAEENQPAAMIQHGYFTLGLQAGQTKTVRIIVKNTGKDVLRISDYPADAAQMAASTLARNTSRSRPWAPGLP